MEKTSLFDKATIKLGNGKQVVIVAKNNSEESRYVQAVRFNGKPLDNCWLYRDELMKGGKLIFTMGNKPNTHWGTKVPPPSAQ